MLAAVEGFTWRTYRSSPEIRFPLAHKCQGSLDFSPSELGRRGTPAGLLSISREEEKCGFTTPINSFFFSCLLPLHCFTNQTFLKNVYIFYPPLLLHHLEVFSDLDSFRLFPRLMRNKIALKAEKLFHSLNQIRKTDVFIIC